MKARARQSKMKADTSPINLFTMQKNLLQVWENLNVDEFYQNLMLSYLDSLSGNDAQNLIAKEIKATHEGSSQYFKLTEKLQKRKKQLTELSNLIKNGETKSSLNPELLSEISELLNELRDHNLVVAEMMINLHRQYNNGGEQNTVSDQCMQMLMNLDTDNTFLKESFLSRFIIFQQGYDPFFLYHYDMKGKKVPELTHPLIDQFFNLNISYACRLFKAKTKVLEMMSSGKYNETKLFKRKGKTTQSSPKRINEYAQAESYRTIEGDDGSDAKRQTSSNFKIRKLSLQKAKEKQRLQSVENSLRESTINRQRPIINQEKLNSLANEKSSENSDDEQECFKLVPVKYRVKKSTPKSQFLLNLRRSDPSLDQAEPSSLKYSLNFKEKLQPIDSKPELPDDDREAPQNRNSIFKRETLKDSLLKQKDPIKSQQEEPLFKREPKLPTSLEKKSTPPSQNKQIKMRPGKLSISQLIQYAKELNVSPELKNETILNSKFEESLSKCQSYLSEFLVNGEVKAAGLSLALPDGDYLIKLWAPLRTCGEQSSKMLLSKFLDYLEKQTACRNIYYSGSSKSLFLSLNFTAKNDKLLFRKRLSPKSTKELQFPQFLSLKCSNLLFSQENKGINMLYSDQIEEFNEKNYYASSSFLEISKERLNSTLQLIAKISEEISDMKALNSLLEDEQFDTYEVTSAMKISNFSAIRLAACLNFRSAFIAGEGFYKFNGEEVFRKNESLVCRIQTAQYNSHILFGKGFPNIHSFIESSKRSQKKGCEFCVKMFSKQLYGRMLNSNVERCSYGNWEFSLSWKDELQGRVKHPMSSFESFGPEPFYFGIEIESELIFCFQVNKEDFLF